MSYQQCASKLGVGFFPLYPRTLCKFLQFDQILCTIDHWPETYSILNLQENFVLAALFVVF